MSRKLFLRLDRDSMPPDDMTAMATAPSVRTVDSDEDCFEYCLEPVVLDHALLLLGENKSRFGFDLWHYLHSVHGFFGQTDDGLVVMPNSTPDFKRRYSEDIGVAVGSLLLVESLGMKWETICQIPTNKRLDKHAKTPDFVGFDTDNNKRVYECKGTTAPSDVDKYQRKAKDQLADHREANVSKFAVVTYVPTSARLLPPYVFVSDPPVPLVLLTEDLAAGLHYVAVLRFAGLDELVEPLQSALAARFRIADAKAADGDWSWHLHELHQESLRFVAAAKTLSHAPESVEIQGHRFAGTWRSAAQQHFSVRAFAGVSIDQVIAVADALDASYDGSQPFNTPRFQKPSVVHQSEPQLLSLFSDGSVLMIESPPKAT